MTDPSRQSDRASEDPRVGDVIKLRHVSRFQRNLAREIVDIDRLADEVTTVGMSGRQRRSRMRFARLAAYDRVGRRHA
jgi:hypothetical protein